jgi:hypothetical protein
LVHEISWTDVLRRESTAIPLAIALTRAAASENTTRHGHGKRKIKSSFNHNEIRGSKP